MNIAVASGKGGTGKTTVSTNLAWVLSQRGHCVAYLDCDVEEPNGHLFLKPDITEKRQVSIPVPLIDESACDGCGQCAQICQFNAIVCLGGKAMVFPELCHGCGGCSLVCQQLAISERSRSIGVVESGACGSISFAQGKLDVGVAMSPPLIREVVAGPRCQNIAIIDAPPGTSCPVITSLSKADFVLLVTEPTPFGLHDLKLAIDMVEAVALPFGVVVNRHSPENQSARRVCSERNAPILCEIPDDRKIAEVYSNGNLASQKLPEYAALTTSLWSKVAAQLRSARPASLP
ncbi:MAG: P-loop NTPase [Chitinivibrionales bacterium]|nr:P-loop NTPase [Chitinivibrionales bacterium]